VVITPGANTNVNDFIVTTKPSHYCNWWLI
jgi:hypothetical protein